MILYIHYFLLYHTWKRNRAFWAVSISSSGLGPWISGTPNAKLFVQPDLDENWIKM